MDRARCRLCGVMPVRHAGCVCVLCYVPSQEERLRRRGEQALRERRERILREAERDA